jgi:hypothetical protein
VELITILPATRILSYLIPGGHRVSHFSLHQLDEARAMKRLLADLMRPVAMLAQVAAWADNAPVITGNHWTLARGMVDITGYLDSIRRAGQGDVRDKWSASRRRLWGSHRRNRAR